MQAPRWYVYTDAAAVCEAAVARIAASAAAALAARGAFHIVLAGGTTPKAVYARLPELQTDWTKWHIYYGDERCLPPGDAERNSHMAQQAWLDKVLVPTAQHHVIHAERGAGPAAQSYAAAVAGVVFDLVLLGLGEDGHTASLFPGHVLGDAPDAPDVLAVANAPKPPPDRVSLSLNCLSRARQVCFLVTGAGKRQAVHAWQAGESLPAAHVHCAAGVDVLIEQASLAGTR